MTRYYLEVIKEGLSICLDTDIQYHHEFKIGDIIYINAYPYKNIHSNKVVFGPFEYNAQFTLDWTKTSSVGLGVTNCITKGYLKDVTIQMLREKKLNQLSHKDNSNYLSLVDEELKSIRCIKDYMNVYSRGVDYSCRLYKHDETGIMIYVVYHDVSLEPSYFTNKDSLSKHFDITSITREEKLNSLGI